MFVTKIIFSISLKNSLYLIKFSTLDKIKTIFYCRLAEIIELETENYLKMDPDPFDERHPSRTDPECKLGQILKIMFRKDNFMSKASFYYKFSS